MSRYRTYPFGIGATRRPDPPGRAGATAPPEVPAASAGGDGHFVADRSTPGRARPRSLSTTAGLVLLCGPLVLAILLAVGPSAPARAQNAAASPAPANVNVLETGDIAATLRQSSPAYTRESTMVANVFVTRKGKGKTPYVEVRLRILSPRGSLLFQRTVARNNATGTVDFRFVRSLKDLKTTSKEGRFRLEARVFSTGADPLQLHDRLLVVDPSRPRVPLVVVAQFGGSPMSDPTGRFVIDPARNTASRDAVVALSAALQRDSAARMTLGVPPYMLEEWLNISGGYSTVGPEGVRNVAPGTPTPAAYAAALRALATTVQDPRAELTQVPYGAPDLPGLASIGAMSDLGQHYARGISIYRLALEATPSAGTANATDTFPASSLGVLASRRITYTVITTGSISPRATETTPHAGLYQLQGTSVRGLAIDSVASAALATSTPDLASLYETLFSRRSGDATPEPVVAVVQLGPGSPVDPVRLTSTLQEAARSGWVDVLTASEAASRPTTQLAALRAVIPGQPAAPLGYWEDVASGRRYSSAFVAAAGEQDADARTSRTDSLLSESYSWAGPAGDWSQADRGRAFALAARRGAVSVLGKVSLQTGDVTLSGSGGRVPITLLNGSAKELRVRVVATSHELAFPPAGGGPQSPRRVGTPFVQTAVLKPGESFVTVPVDLGQGIAGRMTVTVMAGQVELARTSLNVRASFLNQLAIVAGIVAVLLGLLVYVRRRVRRFQESARSGDEEPSAYADDEVPGAAEAGTRPGEPEPRDVGPSSSEKPGEDAVREGTTEEGED